MGTTQLAIVNSALELVKAQAQITGGTWPNFTGDPSCVTAANVLYGPLRDLLLREIDPDFARITAAPSSASASPIVPWAFEYRYPSDAVRIRQVRPPRSGAGSLADPNDPVPIRASVAFDPTVAAKVVLTNQLNALLVYTANSVPEAYFDPGFAEALSDRLSRPFAMAVAGRPDFARECLEVAERYASIATENAEL